jgi:hypothetical protein
MKNKKQLVKADNHYHCKDCGIMVNRENDIIYNIYSFYDKVGANRYKPYCKECYFNREVRKERNFKIFTFIFIGAVFTFFVFAGLFSAHEQGYLEGLNACRGYILNSINQGVALP